MEPVIESQSTSYDEIPYPAAAYRQSHIARLETLAKLFGMAPVDIRHSRVLELGCADGANLIPMACALPESTFLGVDVSTRQIKAGQEIIAALGLTNIELLQCDIRHIDQSFGVFDYVIAHGVYSWVPPEVQDKILSICSEYLRDHGVAYVSYNTFPGWRMRGMLRDMMVYHARKFNDPKEQIEQARALIQWLGESVGRRITLTECCSRANWNRCSAGRTLISGMIRSPKSMNRFTSTNSSNRRKPTACNIWPKRNSPPCLRAIMRLR